MRPERLFLFEQQKRSYLIGTVEHINDEWIFFDDEADEAFPLEKFFYKEIFIFRSNDWGKGILTDNLEIQGENFRTVLQNNDQIKIRKTLSFTYNLLLQDLHDEAFLQFVASLNKLGYSLYDLIYCYNHLAFQLKENRKGVNFLIFDNGEAICSIHHHFQYGNKLSDRFEYTISTGERIVLQAIAPPYNP